MVNKSRVWIKVTDNEEDKVDTYNQLNEIKGMIISL